MSNAKAICQRLFGQDAVYTTNQQRSNGNAAKIDLAEVSFNPDTITFLVENEIVKFTAKHPWVIRYIVAVYWNDDPRKALILAKLNCTRQIY